VVQHMHSSPAVRASSVGSLLGLSLLGACVIPPSLSVSNGDGGVGNSPPAILSVSADQETLVQPGPVTFGVGQMSTAIVTLLDIDVGDTLLVRWFVDYSVQNALPARVECPSAPNNMPTRTATCDLHTLCVANDVDKPPPGHDLEIVVFDRQPLDPGTPPFQELPPGGLSTNVFYHLECEAQ
jgi:hypothetical protein